MPPVLRYEVSTKCCRRTDVITSISTLLDVIMQVNEKNIITQKDEMGYSFFYL